LFRVPPRTAKPIRLIQGLLALCGLVWLLGACGPKGGVGAGGATDLDSAQFYQGLRTRIDSLERVLAEDSLGLSGRSAPLDTLAAVCLNLATNFPRDAYAPLALWKAAQACRTMGAYQEAIACGKALAEAYPEHTLAPSALFFNALVMNDDLKVPESAAFYLDEILEKYPSDSLAEQARAMKELVGLDEQELLRRLKPVH